jgi:hypothetical protein
MRKRAQIKGRSFTDYADAAKAYPGLKKNPLLLFCYTISMHLIKKGFFAIVFLFLVFSLIKNFSIFQKNISFYKSFKEDMEAEKTKNTRLKTERLLKTSPREVEKTIRNKLSLLKPDEIAIIIPSPSPIPSPSVAPRLPIYQRWWNVFFRID